MSIQPAPDPEALVTRVEELTAQLEAIGDPFARSCAEELAAAVVQLYGAGLERIFAALDEQTRTDLAQDGVVASLMLIHGLYPVSLEERVLEALDQVRPYMESHGGDVEPEQVGRRLLQRALDRQLHRALRRRAAAARSLQAQPRDPVLDPQQLHVAAVGVHVRAHAVQRRLHARLEAHRIEAVDEHEAGHDAVLRELRSCLFVERGEDPLEALAVELDDGGGQLLGAGPGLGIGKRLDLRRELLDAPDELLLGRALDRRHLVGLLRSEEAH